MEWRALEEHFRVATTPEPGPFGDDAIEWDYSRYARALGLMGEPGANDLPHRGCAVLALPEARWDAAEKKYRAWAEDRGWTLWRFSARPTVAVPDPVVYALGVRASGPDSLLFARAAQPFRPAMGARPRSEGMSFPLTPGERWLMASDRVRRRMRVEIALRGLVLFVEEAEWMTPAGLGVLMYLLDAHRAWRARMLSRPARVYVVLATAPEREASVLRMLERFQLAGHTPVARERRKDEKRATGFVPPALRDIEEEYLFGALSAAPVALAEDDVRAVFGASAIERCRAMVDRRLLRLRIEAGQTCFLPSLTPPAEPVHAPLRALVALAARYRQRARRGHEHLALASAGLSLALGCPLRAAAAVARMPHTAGALLPLRLFEEIDAALERARPRLRADHLSVWFSLAAHQRAYDHARDLADTTTDRELRTWKEMLRLVQVVFCTGRAHLDQCLPPDFWPKLKSVALAGPFMDAVCVLGELFWRKRYLSNSDIRQRYEFAYSCLARSCLTQGVSAERLAHVVRVVLYRAALHLDIRSTIFASADAQADLAPSLRAFLRTHQLPGYVSEPAMYTEAVSWHPNPTRSFDYRDRFFAASLTATTGHAADEAVTTAMTITRLSSRGVGLLLRDLVDELLVQVLRRMPPGARHEFGRFLQCVAGARVWFMATNALYLEHGRQEAPGRDAFDDMMATNALLFAGDLAGARDRLMVGLARNPQCPFVMTMLIQSHISLSQKALDVRRLESTAAMIDRVAVLLTQPLRRYLLASLEAGRALCAGRFDLAYQQFWIAHKEIGGTFELTRALKMAAAQSGARAGYAARVSRVWASGARGGASVWTFMRALCRDRDDRTSSPNLGGRAAVSLEYILPALEVWARRESRADAILDVVFFLKESVDAVFQPLGRDFVSLVAEHAPSFYERLRGAVTDRGGDLGVAAPEARALNAALRTLEEAWRDRHTRSVDDRCTRIVIRGFGSRATQACAAGRCWQDDATTYAQLWNEQGGIRFRGNGDAEVVAYGYVGRVRARPAATVLKFRMARRDGDAVDVVVDAGGSSALLGCGRRRSLGGGDTAELFVGSSSAAKKVRAMIEAAARCSYPTLLLGETGAGKDLVARCIHAASRSTSAMVVAECAAATESLLESEFFGHEKGAFTGANASHAGHFERANGSSLLLDGVDSMPARMQAMLLRVLETGDYRPVGATSTRRSAFRLMSAALPALPAMADKGQFRKDLFYRISALRIEIPPLREREEDAQEIAIVHARSLGCRLTGGALRAIAQYDWPGNIRQLRHGIQAASLHAQEGRIGEAAIGDVIGGYGGTPDGGDAEGRSAVDAAWGRALRSLERMRSFGALDFAQAAELSRRSAQRHIARLLRERTITRVGAGRTTRYRLGGDRGS